MEPRRDIPDPRITDAYMKGRIEAERLRRGDRTVTKTARDLCIERLTELEMKQGATSGAASSADTPGEPAAAAEGDG